MRRRLRGVQLGHPSAATGGDEGDQVRSHALLAPSWGRFCRGDGRDASRGGRGCAPPR